jgi:ABC transporter DrrB family efflux protein
MTAAVARLRGPSLRWAVSDTLVLTRRNLLRYVRVPALLAFSTIQPVMFVVLFRYVFGGAIPTGVDYADYLIPGIMIQTVLFGSTQTGVGLAADMAEGVVDRFRSLPMARSAVLTGRTLADTARNLFTLGLITVVGYLIGFDFQAGLPAALGALAVALLVGFAFSWVAASIGMLIRNPEAVQAAGFIWIFPLMFASSLFVPTDTMPGWLQAFADVNPISHAVDATRALSLGGATSGPLLATLAWTAGILVVAVPLAVGRYRRST